MALESMVNLIANVERYGGFLSGQFNCEFCNNYEYDEEMEEYVCEVDMDEDDYARFLSTNYKECPYYQSNDEYKVVRHQM